ncbi:MAG: DUF4097 family beta strand repeat-containing protein [Clostridia bacterium]|nr:DUF4097 family beta strand repeat-containing protein [Clostridia bacterium]
MYNGSKYSRIFVILGVVLLVAGVLLAVSNFADFGFSKGFSFDWNFGGANSENSENSKNSIDQEGNESIKGIDAISIQTVSDNINLIPVDSDEVRAHYYGSYSATNSDYKPELVVEKSGSRLKIKINQKSNVNNFSFRSDLKLDVYIPRQFDEDIEINSTSGEVTVEVLDVDEFKYSNISGDLNAERIEAEKASLNTTSGEINISGEFEKFKFNTVSGNLVSDDLIAKESSYNTTSGEIKLSGKPGDVSAKSISGNLTYIYSDFDNDIEANTVSGEVEISLPADAGFKLDYKTASGDVRTDFEVSGNKGEHNLKGTVGDGDGSVDVQTVSGNLTIRN